MININNKCKGLESKKNSVCICPLAWNCYRYKAGMFIENCTSYNFSEQKCVNYLPIVDYTLREK